MRILALVLFLLAAMRSACRLCSSSAESPGLPEAPSPARQLIETRIWDKLKAGRQQAVPRSNAIMAKEFHTSGSVAAAKAAAKCPEGSWARTEGAKSLEQRRPLDNLDSIQYRDPGSTASSSLDELLRAVAAEPTSTARRYVDLLAPGGGGDGKPKGQHCSPPAKPGRQNGLYDIGVLSRWVDTLVRGDVLADCQGPAIHVSVNRPDLAPDKQNARVENGFREPLSPVQYQAAAKGRLQYGGPNSALRRKPLPGSRDE